MAKTPHNLPLKTKIFSLVIAIIFCIVGSKTIIDYKDILKQKDKLVSEVAKDHAKLLNEIDRVSQENLRIALTIANIQAVKEAVSARDRERLYEQMVSIHRHVNENSLYELRIHFSVPPAKTLLRVWKPEKFDDDLSGFRHTILDVLESGAPLKGLEAGRSGLVVRGLAPIFENGAKPVGVVEVHCNVGEVAKIIAEEYGDQNAIYYIEDVEATLGKANPKKIGRFHEIISPPETLDPLVEAEMLEKGVEKPAAFEVGETLITAWPVKDFKQKNIGVYLRFTDIGHIFEWRNHSMTRMAILAAIFLALGSLITYFVIRSIIKPVNRVIRRLGEGANQVASASDQISSASQSMASGASLQAASIEETSSSMEEMTSMTQRNAENARQADGLMKEAVRIVGEAHQAMDQLVRSMKELSQAGEKTALIIQSIDEIAFQTNLLALNAAVEAARAGETGAGFAVVAEEVRNLAMRAAQAAQETSSLIEGTNRKMNEGGSLAASTNEAFQRVFESSEKMGRLVSEISKATQEQSNGAGQVNLAIEEINRVVQENVANLEESAAAAEEMNSQADQLQKDIHELVRLTTGGTPIRRNGSRAPGRNPDKAPAIPVGRSRQIGDR